MKRTLALLLTTGLVSAASAQLQEIEIAPQAQAALSPEASMEYAAALEALDHANDVDAFTHMQTAANLEPNVADLQMRLASLALARTDVLRGEEAVAAVEVAETSYMRVIENPLASEAEHELAESRLADLDIFLAELAQKEGQFESLGQDYVQQYSALQDRLASARERREVVMRERRAAGLSDQEDGVAFRANTVNINQGGDEALQADPRLLPSDINDRDSGTDTDDNVEADPRLRSGRVGNN